MTQSPSDGGRVPSTGAAPPRSTVWTATLALMMAGICVGTLSWPTLVRPTPSGTDSTMSFVGLIRALEFGVGDAPATMLSIAVGTCLALFGAAATASWLIVAVAALLGRPTTAASGVARALSVAWFALGFGLGTSWRWVAPWLPRTFVAADPTSTVDLDPFAWWGLAAALGLASWAIAARWRRPGGLRGGVTSAMAGLTAFAVASALAGASVTVTGFGSSGSPALSLIATSLSAAHGAVGVAGITAIAALALLPAAALVASARVGRFGRAPVAGGVTAGLAVLSLAASAAFLIDVNLLHEGTPGATGSPLLGPYAPSTWLGGVALGLSVTLLVVSVHRPAAGETTGTKAGA